MVLVDTSIWIDHFRKKNRLLSELLEKTSVACHPLVIGELSCGSMKNRQEILRLLNILPGCKLATHEEVAVLIEEKHLYGMGLGIVDIHLLASALIGSVKLWTRDKKLNSAASMLSISYNEEREQIA